MTWQQNLQNSIKNKEALESLLQVDLPTTNQPIFIPPHIENHLSSSVFFKQFVPSKEELIDDGHQDPIGDFIPGPFPYFIHRYQSRALFFPTTNCPIQCRYCFRKNNLHQEEIKLNPNLEQISNYLHTHHEVEEIIFSGGDPFILSDSKLEEYLTFYSQFKSIKMIRFHTRTPIVLPSRMTKDLKKTLKKFEERFQLTIVLHLNHQDELTVEVKEKLLQIKNFNLLSQSVLLKGINDSVDALENLIRSLHQEKIRPYYLHHPDQVKGAMHFYLSPKEGLKLYQKLRQRLPGWMLPQYILDSASAEGKTPVGLS